MTASNATTPDVRDAAGDAAPTSSASRHNADRHEAQMSRMERLRHRVERKAADLSSRSSFWHKVFSWKFLPLAYRSGIKIHKGSVGTFAAILPFKKFNKNWYNAMAGGALLANAEVAGGMYVLKEVGADWTIVCKRLEYEFLRPCFGPAVYNIEPREDIEQLVRDGKEFNLTVDMMIVQMVQAKKARERRVGKCVASFHITPKTQYLARKRRTQEKEQDA